MTFCLKSKIIKPEKEIKNAVILLHGYGGDGNDVIIGGKGSDSIDGGNGDDVLTGNKGRDLFIMSPGEDTIADFNVNKDLLQITPFDSLKNVAEVDGSVELTFKGVKGRVLLQDVILEQFDASTHVISL